MPFQYTPYTAPVFLSALVGLGVALFVLRHRDRTGAKPLALFMVGASLWSFAEGMNLAHADLAGKVFWTQVEITLTGIVPLSFFLLVLEYTGNDEYITPRSLALLLVEPMLVAAVIWVQPSLFRTDVALQTVGGYQLITETFGPAYYVHLIYSYLLLLIAGALLLRVILFAEGLYRAQATALLVSGFIPIIGNVMYTFDLLPSGIDPTNLGFLFTGFIITVTILRRQLLEIVPVARNVARDEILENMDDRVIVLDEQDHIADLNPAAASLVDATENEAIGRQIEETVPEVADLLDDETDSRFQAELSLENGDGVRYYDVRVSPLHRAGGLVTGTLVSLRDVTQRRQQRQRLDVLNRLLRHNLRNEMNVIVGNAELVEAELEEEDLVDRMDTIETTATEITSRSDKVGRVARMLDDEESVVLNLRRVVNEEAADVTEVFPHADIRVDLSEDLLVAVGSSVAIAIHELLVNAVEHNDGQPVIEVTATDTDQFVVLEISDNGPGIDEHELDVLDEGKETALQHGSGVGLWVVNWIVEQFGGRLEFENTAAGCTVTIRLPAAGRVGETDDDSDTEEDDLAVLDRISPPSAWVSGEQQPGD